MRPVVKELAPGVKALRNLLAVVRQALRKCKLTFRQDVSWDYIGYSCQANKYWVGVYFDAPTSLFFETDEFVLAWDGFDQTGIGGKFEEHWDGEGRQKWTDRLDLAPAPGDFFALTLPEQVERVRQFIESCVERAGRIPFSPLESHYIYVKARLPKAFSVRDENEFLPIRHLMVRLNRGIGVKRVATGMHVNGGGTVFWGLVYWRSERPTKKQVERALREAGFDFARNVLTQAAFH